MAKATSAPLPKERVAECNQICAGVEMKLGAFVVIHSSAGCVCESVAESVSHTNAGRAGVTAGAALTTIEQEEAARSAQQAAAFQPPPVH